MKHGKAEQVVATARHAQPQPRARQVGLRPFEAVEMSARAALIERKARREILVDETRPRRRPAVVLVLTS